MSQLIDMRGRRFGRLIVLERAPNVGERTMWKCICDCGNEKIVDSHSLRLGHTKSCGCLGRQRLEEGRYKHGLSKTRLYGHFEKMVDRCENKNSKHYHNYGERGISICDEWRHDFKAFYDWSVKNGYKEGLSIDRIDNNKGYSPDNCRWATQLEQMNNVRTNRNIEYNGEVHSVSEWSRIIGINIGTLTGRLNKGWSAEEALFTPVNKKYSRDMKKYYKKGKV